MTKSSLFTLLLLTAVAAPAVPAGQTRVEPHWEPVGWGGGGYYFSAAFHPTRDGVLFLGMDVSGVAKSTDHGRTFRLVNTGLKNYAMYSLAADWKNPDVVYAVTEGGLHKSVDCGETWSFVPGTGRKELRITAERNRSVRAIAVDPTDGNIVYAASPGGKIYKSTDGARNWRAVYQKSGDGKAGAASGLRVQFGQVNDAYFGGIWTPLAFPSDLAPADAVGIGLTLQGDGSRPKDCHLTLRTATGAIYRSRNLGDAFTDDTPRDVILGASDFAIDPTFAKKEPQKAAAARKTPDWSTVTRLDFACAGALPTQASVVRLGRVFFVAHDANRNPVPHTVRDFEKDKRVQTYGNIRLGDPVAGTIYSVVVSHVKPSRVIAATADHGLVLSDDKGETWRVLSTPAKAAIVAFDPGNADVIHGAFWADGVWKSTDAGATWTKSVRGLGEKFSAREIVVSPDDPREVYVIGSEGWNGGFYHSSDAGASWTRSSRVAVDPTMNPTLPAEARGSSLSTPTNLTLNPRNPRQLYISANWRPVFSEDGGRTWEERVRGADITVHTDIRFSGDRVYVSAMDEGTLVSEDQGKSWRALWPRKYDSELSGHNWRLAVNNINGVDRIIATASSWNGRHANVVVISEDGGKTFTTTTAGLPKERITANTMWGRGYARALAVDPSDPLIVYLGIDGDPSGNKPGGGIFKSEDGGHTWKQLPNQPSSRRMYYGLAVDPTNPQRLYWGACDRNGGVHRSEDGGQTWEHVFKRDQWIFNVHVDGTGTLYAGGSNLWRSTDHGETWQQITRLKEKRAVVGIETDPRDPRTMWISAVTWDNSDNGGVYQTTDGGANWVEVTGDLSHRKPQILRFNPGTHELWSGQTVLHKTGR